MQPSIRRCNIRTSGDRDENLERGFAVIFKLTWTDNRGRPKEKIFPCFTQDDLDTVPVYMYINKKDFRMFFYVEEMVCRLPKYQMQFDLSTGNPLENEERSYVEEDGEKKKRGNGRGHEHTSSTEK